MWHEALPPVLGLLSLSIAAIGIALRSATTAGGIPRAIQRAAKALAAKRFQQAERILRNAIQHHPDSAACHAYLGYALHGQQQLEAAVATYYRALSLPDEKIGALESSHAYASNYLGQILKSQGNLEAARIAFERVVAFNPNSDLAHFRLGQILQSQGNSAAAREAFCRAIALAPQYSLTVAYEDLGNDADRVVAYRRAIELAPGYADNYGLLGKALHDRGQRQEAEAAYRQAIALNPFSVRYYNRLVKILYEQR